MDALMTVHELQTTDVEMATPTTVTPLNNPPVSTIVSLNNTLMSTITTLNNIPVSSKAVFNKSSMATKIQQNIVIQQQHQLQQLQQMQQQQKLQQQQLKIKQQQLQQIQQQKPHSLQQLMQQQSQLLQQSLQTQQQQQLPQSQQIQQPQSSQEQPQTSQQEPQPSPKQPQLSQQQSQQKQQQSPPAIHKNVFEDSAVALLTKDRLRELVKEVDPNEQLDEDVEDLMLELSNDFVNELVKAACVFAKHRKSSIVEVKDVQLYLERYLNMSIPGFGTDELKPYRKAPTTEAHKLRISLIKKKSSRKY